MTPHIIRLTKPHAVLQYSKMMKKKPEKLFCQQNESSVCYSIIFFWDKNIKPLAAVVLSHFFYSFRSYIGIVYIKFTPLTMSSLKYINKLDVRWRIYCSSSICSSYILCQSFYKHKPSLCRTYRYMDVYLVNILCSKILHYSTL